MYVHCHIFKLNVLQLELNHSIKDDSAGLIHSHIFLFSPLTSNNASFL